MSELTPDELDIQCRIKEYNEDIQYFANQVLERQRSCKHRLVEETILFSTLEKKCQVCGWRLR